MLDYLELRRTMSGVLKLGMSPGSKDAIESVVNDKNAVAHGKPATATLRDVEKFHQQIVPIFDAIEDILAI